MKEKPSKVSNVTPTKSCTSIVQFSYTQEFFPWSSTPHLQWPHDPQFKNFLVIKYIWWNSWIDSLVFIKSKMQVKMEQLFLGRYLQSNALSCRYEYYINTDKSIIVWIV